jgi:hypothetical protein
MLTNQLSFLFKNMLLFYDIAHYGILSDVELSGLSRWSASGPFLSGMGSIPGRATKNVLSENPKKTKEDKTHKHSTRFEGAGKLSTYFEGSGKHVSRQRSVTRDFSLRPYAIKIWI